MTPVIAIVGRSHAGKTTVIEKIIKELRSRGYRIATVKHTPLGMSTGDSNKNSQRHLAAGSEAVLIAGNDQLVMVKRLEQPVTLADASRLLGDDYDLIIAEGFKQADIPKIEVHRREVGTPLTNLKKLFAIITDEALDTKVRQFAHEDVKGVADLVEIGFIQPQRSCTQLYVNNEAIELSAFPREFLTNTILGMTHSLKGVSEINSLKIIIKKPGERQHD